MALASDAWKLDSAAPELVESADLAATVNRALLTLTAREERAVRLRYFKGASYDEVGDEFGVTKERARQIIQKAMRKLKHPSRSGKLRAALYGDLSFRHYFDAEPKTPSEAQEMARQLRELQEHIENTKRRKAREEAANAWLRRSRDKFYAHVWVKQHPTMGEGRCLIRIVRIVAATTDGEMIIMRPGEAWLVDEQHRDDLVALGYAVID